MGQLTKQSKLLKASKMGGSQKLIACRELVQKQIGTMLFL
jgi:hypothetical protein